MKQGMSNHSGIKTPTKTLQEDGLEPSQYQATRLCLRCDQPFLSQNPKRIRCCPRCHKCQAWQLDRCADSMQQGDAPYGTGFVSEIRKSRFRKLTLSELRGTFGMITRLTQEEIEHDYPPEKIAAMLAKVKIKSDDGMGMLHRRYLGMLHRRY